MSNTNTNEATTTTTKAPAKRAARKPSKAKVAKRTATKVVATSKPKLIHGVPEKLWLAFKAHAAINGVSMGEAFTEIMGKALKGKALKVKA